MTTIKYWKTFILFKRKETLALYSLKISGTFSHINKIQSIFHIFYEFIEIFKWLFISSLNIIFYDDAHRYLFFINIVYIVLFDHISEIFTNKESNFDFYWWLNEFKSFG